MMESAIKILNLKVIKRTDTQLLCKSIESENEIEQTYLLIFSKEKVSYNINQYGVECFLDIFELTPEQIQSIEHKNSITNDNSTIISLRTYENNVIYEKNPITNIVSISNEVFYISFWGPDALEPHGYYYIKTDTEN